MKKLQLIFLQQLVFSICLLGQHPLSSRIDSLFNSFLQPGEPGGAVLIAKNNKIIFSKGYGVADINTKEPVTVHTSFNLGSISKTFVSNAILILQQRQLVKRAQIGLVVDDEQAEVRSVGHGEVMRIGLVRRKDSGPAPGAACRHRTHCADPNPPHATGNRSSRHNVHTARGKCTGPARCRGCGSRKTARTDAARHPA